jgi:hypothetical protein
LGVKLRLVAAFALIASLTATTLVASAQDAPPYDVHAYDFHAPEFYDVWERTDRPVQDGDVERSWLWGPDANTPLIEEPYEEADGGMRDVQYSDKSRMELPWTDDVDDGSPWFITQGLLALEMMTGELQIGDNEFVSHFPAQIPVAGDPGSGGPTYATMGNLIDQPARSEGNVVTDVITADGHIFQNDALGPAYGVTDEYWIEQTDQYIASVFWDFMTSSGPIYEDDTLQTGQLFQSPFYAIGFPVTPAYWGWVTVNEVEQNVLIQCFERRCLTFTPDNTPEWQIESGNVGQHYFHWRYEQIGDPVPPVPEPDPEISSFSVSPASSTNAVGDVHEITVSVEDQYGDPWEGAAVSASVTDGPHDGTNLDPDDATTGSDGEVALSYTGTDEGEDTITVSVDGIDDDQTVTKTWVNYSVEIDPEASVNPVGTEHEFTATLFDIDDQQIDIDDASDVSLLVDRDGSSVNVNESIEVEDGVATISYTGPDEPADDEITVTVDIDDVTTASGSATKQWLNLVLNLDPSDAENILGSAHTVTASVEDPDGDVELDGTDDVTVAIDRDYADDGTADEEVDSEDITVAEVDGDIEITWDGPDELATDTLTVSVTVETDEGTFDLTAQATKSWADVSISVTPDDAENPFFEGESAFGFTLLTAIHEAGNVSETFDVNQFLVDLVDLGDLEDALGEQLDPSEVTAVQDVIADAGVNEHTFTVDVTVPAGGTSTDFDVLVEHEDDTVLLDEEDVSLTDGEASEEFTYTAAGVGFDTVTVTVEGEDYVFEDAKEWVAQPVTTTNELDLTPLDPDPNPTGSDHTVAGKLTESGTGSDGVENALVFFEITGGPNDGLAGGGFTDASGNVDFTYTDDEGVEGTDTITATAYYFDGAGNLVEVEANDEAEKEWYIPATQMDVSVSSVYNHPADDDWDGVDVEVQLLDADNNEVTHDYQDLSATLTWPSGGGIYAGTGTDIYESGRVEAFSNGAFSFTFVSDREFWGRPLDVMIDFDADGIQAQETATFPDTPLLTIVQNELDGAQQDHTGLDLQVNVMNPADGADIDEAIFKTTFSHETYSCSDGDTWEDIFEFTEIDTIAADDQTQQTPETYAAFLNSTFECENGDWVGSWGDGANGEDIFAGFDQTDTFTITVGANTAPGQWTLTSEMVNKDDDTTIFATVTGTFTINEGAPPA